MTDTTRSDFHRTGRLCRKIDLFRRGKDGQPARYLGSTNWFRRCRDAARAIAETHGINPAEVYGRFDRSAR